MKLIAAILLLYSPCATPEQINMEWWQSEVFGYCTATDRAELGGCGTLEVKDRPDWR